MNVLPVCCSGAACKTGHNQSYPRIHSARPQPAVKPVVAGVRL